MHKKTIIIIGNNSAVGRYMGELMSDRYNIVYTGYRGSYDIELDISKEFIKKILLDYEGSIVVNCAAKFGNNREDWRETVKVNTIGALTALDFANSIKAKHFIQISSISALEEKGSKYYNIYSLSKRYGEELIQLASKECKINLTIMRPSALYDENGLFRKHQRLLFTMIEAASRGENIKLYGTNDAIRNILYIGDFIYYIQEVIRHNITGIYNCLGETIQLSSIAKSCYEQFKQGGEISWDCKKENIADIVLPTENMINEIIDISKITTFKDVLAKIEVKYK